MLSAARNATRSPEIGDLDLLVAIVAGACNHSHLEFPGQWRTFRQRVEPGRM